VQRHAEAVATRHKVDVLYVTPDPEVRELTYTFNQRGSIREHIWYYPAKKPDPWYRFRAFKAAFKAWHSSNGTLPDLVHLNVLYPSGKQARWLRSKFDIPFIVTEHWTGYHEEHQVKLHPYQRIDMLKTARVASCICPVSQHLADAMFKWGIKGGVQVVANVVDTDLFHRAEAQKKNAHTVLHVSSLVDDHKNISGMLEVIQRVTAERNDVRFEIVGDGDIVPHLNKAKELHIPEDQLLILGEQSLEEIAERMRQASVFMLFSRYENLPCVILEAFASGVPVVSSDVGGIHEHLDPDKGILVESEDQDGLYDALCKMLDEPTPDPEKLREYAVSNFSIEQIAAQFTAVYRSTLERS
jgi:glycosyltransferase involved in cell wall biosynthesis